MAITKEFTVLMEDRPSMLLLALQSFPNRGRFVIRPLIAALDVDARQRPGARVC
jgi:hypothetical protein